MTIIGCREEITRRAFLGGAGAALSFAAFPQFAVAGAEATDGRLLVILLRGGMDGLYAVPPVGDPNLRDHRKDLVEQNLLTLDSFFSLHPAMPNFHALYQKGQAIVVHGASIPYMRRSHFEGQNMMEGGMDAPYTSNTGWLGRALDAAGLPAVTMSLPVPLILRGKSYVDSTYPSFMQRPPEKVYDLLLPIWSPDPAIGPIGKSLVAEVASTLDITRNEPDQTSIDVLARQAGHAMSGPNGPRIGLIDDFGYDTHSKEPDHAADKLAEIDKSIAAFAAGLGPALWAKSLVVTVTEFGRTVAENGAWGTDHGYGTCSLVAGGVLKKSGVVADWPGLKPNNLFEGRDLQATMDIRSLYAAALTATLGLDPDLVRANVLNSPKTTAFDAYI